MLLRTISTFALMALFIAASSCSAPRTMTYPGTEDPNFDYFIIKVDSLEMVGTGPTTRITALGTVGPNGCHQLAYVDTMQSGFQMHFTFWGSKPKSETAMCTQAIVPLRHELVFTRHGVNTVVINQPDGTQLRRAF